jgi:hypothetical protein
MFFRSSPPILVFFRFILLLLLLLLLLLPMYVVVVCDLSQDMTGVIWLWLEEPIDCSFYFRRKTISLCVALQQKKTRDKSRKEKVQMVVCTLCCCPARRCNSEKVMRVSHPHFGFLMLIEVQKNNKALLGFHCLEDMFY